MISSQASRPSVIGAAREARTRGPVTLSDRDDGITVGLALFRIALGVTELLAPDALARAVGLRPSPGARAITRALGMRQLSAGYGLLHTPESRIGSWSRMAGDALDLSMLVVGTGRRADDRHRATRAAVTIAGVAAMNLYCASQARQGMRERQIVSGSAPIVVPRRAVSDAFELRDTAPRDSTVDASLAENHGTHVAVGGADMRMARHSVTIARPAAELYAVWRDFANLPSFMRQLESVTTLDGTRWHWVTRAPGGSKISWDTEIVADVPGELIAWQSLPDAAVYSAGTVRFVPTPSGRSTLVHLSVEYSPATGSLGEVVAKLFRVEPAQQMEADLDAFKALMDAGFDHRGAVEHARAPTTTSHARVPLAGDSDGRPS